MTLRSGVCVPILTSFQLNLGLDSILLSGQQQTTLQMTEDTTREACINCSDLITIASFNSANSKFLEYICICIIYECIIFHTHTVCLTRTLTNYIKIKLMLNEASFSVEQFQ